ncbi:response regulator transcription factor [Candidatus Gracilibacteria bacterium]|nr:response regulator transcription factor [Candidatus Gracilibacteria bacterium]
MNVLVVEDDRVLGDYICATLAAAGNVVSLFHQLSPVIEKKAYVMNDVVVLDLMLGNESGKDLVKEIRGEGFLVPILILSGVSDVFEKVELLNLGADDYLVKPFARVELVARVEALYRRSLEIPKEGMQSFGDLVIYWDQGSVVWRGRMLKLTANELKFLRILLLNRGHVVRSEDIVRKVWNVGPGYHSNVLQSLVKRLRRRLEDESGYRLIHNVHGTGYFIKVGDGENYFR